MVNLNKFLMVLTPLLMLDLTKSPMSCNAKKVDDVTSGIEPVTSTSALNQKILTLAIKISLII